MTTYIMNEIKVNEHILDDDKYLLIFSVEEVNRLAREGMATRPQTTLFLLICSIKVALNGNKSHQELQFIANKCNHNGNSTHICPFLTTTLQNSR